MGPVGPAGELHVVDHVGQSDLHGCAHFQEAPAGGSVHEADMANCDTGVSLPRNAHAGAIGISLDLLVQGRAQLGGGIIGPLSGSRRFIHQVVHQGGAQGAGGHLELPGTAQNVLLGVIIQIARIAAERVGGVVRNGQCNRAGLNIHIANGVVGTGIAVGGVVTARHGKLSHATQVQTTDSDVGAGQGQLATLI